LDGVFQLADWPVLLGWAAASFVCPCGAIKGAIDNAELGNLTELLDKIKPAVHATNYSGERSSKNYAFVDAVARTNVQMTMDNVRKNSAVLADLESKGTIKIVGAMYNLETAALEFLR
jgi:carbonic anhydrase